MQIGYARVSTDDQSLDLGGQKRRSACENHFHVQPVIKCKTTPAFPADVKITLSMCSYRLRFSSRYNGGMDSLTVSSSMLIASASSVEITPAMLDLQGKYEKWYDFSRYVLTPALEEINDFGTVDVTATPHNAGRSIRSVRFNWKWKNIDSVRVTDEETVRHKLSRHKASDGSAPPHG